MLATGNAAVTEVASRQVAERPEARESEASGGQFAGLMAHWIQPQMAPKPPEKAQGGTPETGYRKATSAKPAAGSPAATPDAPPAPDEARSALKPGVSATPPSAPSQPSPSAKATASDTATPANNVATPASGAPASADDAAAAAPTTTPAAAALPPTAAGLPDPSSLVPAPDSALATLAALALSTLQTGGTGSPLPSAPFASPREAAKTENQPKTADSGLDPIPLQASTTTQAVLAEDAAKSKGKGPTKELQTALEAPLAPSLTAGSATSKSGPDLAVPTAPQDAPAVTPLRTSLPSAVPGLSIEPSQVDAGTFKALSFAHATDGLPADAAAATLPATLSQHADNSAMAAISALPRTSTPVAGAMPTAPPPNTPAQPSPLASPLVTQVEGGLRWMLKGGSQEAQLQLHPDSLGQVTIHLRVEGGEVHARLWVTEASSVQAVQEGRPHLEASLKEQGLQLGSFDLQQGQRPFQEATATPTYPERPVLEAASAGQEAPAVPVASILNASHVELYA